MTYLSPVVNVFFVFFSTKIILILTYLFWNILWKNENKSCNGLNLMVLIIICFILTVLFNIIFFLCRPLRTTSKIVHSYMLLCSFSFLNYSCFFGSQGFYIGKKYLIMCPQWKDNDPDNFGFVLFITGISFFIFESILLGFILHKWQKSIELNLDLDIDLNKQKDVHDDQVDNKNDSDCNKVIINN